MNYLLKSKPKYPHRISVIFVVVLFVLLSLSAFLFPNAIRTSLYSVSRPLWSFGGLTAKSFVSVKNFFIFKSMLVDKNLFLQDELSSLRLKQIDYEILLKENQDLKTELGRRGKSNRIIANILSKPPQSPYDTFIIDVGSESGVSIGDKVYISSSIIVGLVKNVTTGTSVVQLFSTGGEKQEATLERTRTSFVLEGTGGGNFKLEVPKDTDVLWGDVFLYPVSSSSIIGSVYYIDANSQSSFKTIYLRTPVNIFSTRYVFIEKNQ